MTGSALITAAARTDAASPHRGARGPRWFDDVLVGVDGSPTGRDAIALGNMLRDPSGRLTLAHVLLSQTPSYRNFHATPAWANSRRMLERESDASGVVAELTGMASSSVGGGLHQLAEDCGADLLVVGSCRRGSVGRLLRGDNSRGSLSDAACAVAIAPHGYAERSRQIKMIGVAYNDTPESEAALAAARSLAPRLGASVQAPTVVSLAAAGPGAWERSMLVGEEGSRGSSKQPGIGFGRWTESTAAWPLVFRARSWSRSGTRLTCLSLGRAALARFDD